MHRLRADDTVETRRVKSELSRLYFDAKACLADLVNDNEKRLLESREGLDTLLNRLAQTRRNKEKTPYWKIGALLEERWKPVVGEKIKGKSEASPTRDTIEMTKTVSRRYRRAKRLIAGTEKGLFPQA
jgi:hypothetical protein